MGISIEIKELDNDHFDINASGTIKTKVRNDHKPTAMETLLRPSNLWSETYYDETETLIKVKGTRVVDVSTRPVIVKKQTFTNNNPSVPTLFSTFIEETVSNSVSSTWTNENKFTGTYSISYEVKPIKHEGSLSYSHTWGSSSTNSKSITLKSGSSAQMTLEAGQSATVELAARKKIAKIEITYECQLNHESAFPFHSACSGFGGPLPHNNTVMRSKGTKTFIIKEQMEIELYGDSYVNVS